LWQYKLFLDIRHSFSAYCRTVVRPQCGG